MDWRNILKLTDEKNKEEFSSENDYDYDANSTKQEMIHDSVMTVFAVSSISATGLPKPHQIKTALEKTKDRKIQLTTGPVDIISSDDVDAYIAARPYLVLGGKLREETIKTLQSGGSTIDGVEVEEDGIRKPEPPKIERKDRLKKEAREKAKHRSNWQDLSEEQQEEAIQKTIAAIENPKKKEIDEKSAPTPKDAKGVKKDKATKLAKPNPKALPDHKLGRDFSGLDKAVTSRKNSGKFVSKQGVNHSPLREPVPLYNDASTGERKIHGASNSWITLGRDRPGNKASGYGGKGHTQAAAIDLVVGRMGSSPRSFDRNGDRLQVDNNFTVDSARIYISQKTDVDDNFNLAAGKVGNARTRSAIGIKADHVRVIAREGIKLVTRTDFKNSQGGAIKSTSGIDLIAGNDDKELQPIAKGHDLVMALEELSVLQYDLNSAVYSFLKAQMQLNNQLAMHIHPYYFGPVYPDPNLQNAVSQTMQENHNVTFTDLKSHITNLNNWRENYLLSAGDGYILSRYNNVN